MKYHMTLKTGVMTAENAAMPSQKKKYFLTYIQIEN